MFKLQYCAVNGTFFLKLVLCLQQEIVAKIMEAGEKFHNMEENIVKLEEKIENLQLSFMNKGNVTMVNMIVGNSQIQRAVDL